MVKLNYHAVGSQLVKVPPNHTGCCLTRNYSTKESLKVTAFQEKQKIIEIGQRY